MLTGEKIVRVKENYGGIQKSTMCIIYLLDDVYKLNHIVREK